MPRASHSRISDATDTLERSRSSFDKKPLVSPASEATSAMDLRAASRAPRSAAPIRTAPGTSAGWPPGTVPGGKPGTAPGLTASGTGPSFAQEATD